MSSLTTDRQIRQDIGGLTVSLSSSRASSGLRRCVIAAVADASTRGACSAIQSVAATLLSFTPEPRASGMRATAKNGRAASYARLLRLRKGVSPWRFRAAISFDSQLPAAVDGARRPDRFGSQPRAGRRAGAGAPDRQGQGHAERLSLLLRRMRARSSTPSTARSSTSKAIPAARTTRAPSARRARRPSSCTSTPIGRPRCCTGRPAPPSGRSGTSNRAMDRVAELVKKTRDETFIEKLQNGKVVNATTGHLLARRRHARQRVEPHPAEADARPGHRRHREPGPDMT